MPERIYQGSHDAVELVVDEQPVLVRKGQPVTVSDEQAAAMDVSDAWAAPGAKPKKKE